MPLRPRDNLHWCNCVGRIVFLDVAADRYFCLTSVLNDAFLRLTAGELRSEDSIHLAILRERGILVDDPIAPPIPLPPFIEAAVSDYPAAGGTNVLHLMCALASEAHFGWSLRKRALGQLIEAARRRRPRSPRCPSDPQKSLEPIVGAAKIAAYLTRTHDRCLVRGFAVHAACKKRGIDAKLVFGVISNPFAAHCWVQLGSTVLVGGFEQARLYTPILVVE